MARVVKPLQRVSPMALRGPLSSSRTSPTVCGGCPSPRRRPVGAHVSIRGRLYDAIPRAVAIGCECLQIFVGSPRQWRIVHYAPADLEEFRSRRASAGLDPLVAHTLYLINLASPDPRVFRRSTEALVHTVQVM